MHNLYEFIFQDFSEYSDFSSYQSNDSVLGFGSEDVKRPGKPREKLSKSASKSYLRNEVIIRNSDSGKGKFKQCFSDFNSNSRRFSVIVDFLCTRKHVRRLPF